MNRFVIIGGGTAGWLTALTLNKFLPYADITVISSEEIGILGAGEGVTPLFNVLIDSLDISIDDLFKNTKATKKLGIHFTNWNGDGTSYFHPFWLEQSSPDSSLHFDARLMAKYLQSIALERGVKHIEGVVEKINNKSYNEDIGSFDLISGENVPCDFVFDCSGLHRLVIGKHYNAKWNDYSDMLPCNRALPFFIQHNDENIPEYTESIAMKYGWIWKIPVQGRYGCGYVFDKRFITDEEAITEIKEIFGDIHIPKAFDFKAGAYETPWMHNCVAIGLSSGFTEPLEATSIWLQMLSLKQYIEGEPAFARDRSVCDWYNKYVGEMNIAMRDFIHAHYLTRRNDSEFWKTFREKNSTPDYVVDIKSMNELEQRHMDYLQEVYSNEYKSPIVLKSWQTIIEGTK